MKNRIVNDWIDYLESIKEHSSNTIKSYELDVIEFLQYYKYRSNLVEDISIYEIDKIEIDDISESLIKEIGVRDILSYVSYTDKYLENSSTTRSRKLSSLRSFFNYLYKVINLIDENPISLVDGPKIPKRMPHYLELKEVQILLTTVLENDDDFYRKRDFAIIMLFLNTGLRISELVNVELGSIDKNNSLKIIGKGNKERIVFVNKSAMEAINDYMTVRPDTDILNLFTDKSGENFLGVRGIEYMLKKYIKKSGLSSKITPHSLRHTAATLLYKYGDVDIRTLQVLLGHESISTTEIYTHVDTEQLKSAVDLNPIEKLNLQDGK